MYFNASSKCKLSDRNRLGATNKRRKTKSSSEILFLKNFAGLSAFNAKASCCTLQKVFDALPPHAVAAAYLGPINTTTHNGIALSMLHSTLRGWQRQRLCWNVSGAFGSRRGDNANRRVLQPAAIAACIREQNTSSLWAVMWHWPNCASHSDALSF
jgi:hypothetical protein